VGGRTLPRRLLVELGIYEKVVKVKEVAAILKFFSAADRG
jgi:hypothetical protein